MDCLLILSQYRDNYLCIPKVVGIWMSRSDMNSWLLRIREVNGQSFARLWKLVRKLKPYKRDEKKIFQYKTQHRYDTVTST